jgi:hypothetical protein
MEFWSRIDIYMSENSTESIFEVPVLNILFYSGPSHSVGSRPFQSGYSANEAPSFNDLS